LRTISDIAFGPSCATATELSGHRAPKITTLIFFRLQSGVSFIHSPFLSFTKEREKQVFIVTYAVLETGSKQYRVTAGDVLEVDRLRAEAGQSFTFDRVLLVNNDGQVAVGAPTVANASVLADIVEHLRGPKKVAFKMKRRKGYHRTVGHRQELTKIKVTEIKI
jgi:large subunit ribosomal protein L21